MKKLKYLFSSILAISLLEITYACSTCYGDPNSGAGKGMDMAIITLLSIIAPLLFAIAAGIVSIGLKSRKINQQNHD
tara:strand:+ start:255 stop:485 length:231 start_codon:yes stop_codon:yes gene_type:complete